MSQPLSLRIVARLDVKPPDVIKGVFMEGLKKIGAPDELAARYERAGADEIFYVDHVASLYNLPPDRQCIQQVARKIEIPLIVAGGIQSLATARSIFNAGADVVALNTFAIRDPQLIRQIANEYGAQSVAVHVDCKHQGQGYWECYTQGGREHTGVHIENWVQTAQELGAGQIILSSVDADGALEGPDWDSLQQVIQKCRVPIVVSSGIATRGQVEQLQAMNVNGVAIGAAFHYGILSPGELKSL